MKPSTSHVIMTPQDPPAIQVCLVSEPARRLGFGTLRRECPSWAESPHGMKSAGDDPISTFKLKFIGVSHN